MNRDYIGIMEKKMETTGIMGDLKSQWLGGDVKVGGRASADYP